MQIEQHKTSLVALAIAPTLTEAGEYGAGQFLLGRSRRDAQAGAPGCAAQPREGEFGLPLTTDHRKPLYHPIESPSSLKLDPAR
jgi:hypothetical protein